MIQFSNDICSDPESARSREWLETNGRGGYASATILGMNTRRYHGLLVAAVQPPTGRLVMLSKLEETLVLGERRFDLSVNQYPGALYPEGYRYLTGFRMAPFPVFTFVVEGLEIEKSIFMIHGENSVAITYEVRRLTGNAVRMLVDPERRARLELRPLVAFREYHALIRENGHLDPAFDSQPGLIALRPYADRPALHLAHNARQVEAVGHWYRNFEYEIERERGFDFHEDLFNPCVLEFDLQGAAAMIASTEPRDIRRLAEYRQAEIARRNALTLDFASTSELINDLVESADRFIVERGDRRSVIAGYHWFGDRGRDMMIALPGLTLVTGRTDIAQSILLEFADHVDDGQGPNRLLDADESPERNMADATLWFFEAVRAWVAYGGDLDVVGSRLYPLLRDIVDRYVDGTRYGIRVDADGLLTAGEEAMALTWMDARIGDRAVTPRCGKPVEIQALWYNALRVMEDLARRFDAADAVRRYAAMAVQANERFNDLFWNDVGGGLYDVIDGDLRDASIRPNQIFAVSLCHSMLNATQSAQVVDLVERELLTPYGLRTLSPHDPAYMGRYQGNAFERDAAYHQGSVWPWLLGPFITAYVRAHGASQQSKERARELLEGFVGHLHEAGLGQISEIFDGDFPYHPRGCMAQAWSVAELLRAAVEDVEGRRGKGKFPRSRNHLMSSLGGAPVRRFE